MAIIFIFFFSLTLGFLHGIPKRPEWPTHCTQITKETDQIPKYNYSYREAYIVSGRQKAHQDLLCVDPAAVNKATTIVCDWAAAPEVSYTLDDHRVNVVRQDPSGKFPGNAIVKTEQLCSHINLLSDPNSKINNISLQVQISELNSNDYDN